MIISHIVAVSKNFVIGKNNRLPWKMPADSKYFHDITMGHIVIMGRKNYEANKGALPGRTNIVISRKKNYKIAEESYLASSIEEALDIAKSMGDDEIFIVGGGEIYKETLKIINRIYITIIDTVAEGDTFYPEINIKDYQIISKIRNKSDRKNPFDFTYYILNSKNI
jgi:dihydrofolate reductase